jgi:hypothetical protein
MDIEHTASLASVGECYGCSSGIRLDADIDVGAINPQCGASCPVAMREESA